MRVMFSGWHHSAYRREIISLLSSVCLSYDWLHRHELRLAHKAKGQDWDFYAFMEQVDPVQDVPENIYF